MNLSAIFSKTGKGVQEASGKTSQLSRADRAVLSAIDGKTSLVEVQKKFEKLDKAKFEALIQQLDKDGFIREVSSGAVSAPSARPAAPPPRAAPPPPPSGGSDDDMDFTQAIKLPPKAPAPAAPKPPPVDLAAAARADAERKAKEQQGNDYKARQEAEAKAKAEAELKARAAAEARAKADAESRARAEAEAKAKSEAEAKARADADSKTRAEAEAKVKAAREAAVRMATEAKARAEAEARAKMDEAERGKAQLEAELNAKLDAERKAREDAERRAAEAGEQARKQMEEKARRDEEVMRQRLEAEMKAQLENERKARAEEDRKREEEAKKREEEAKKQREEEDRRRKEEDERRAKEDAERRAKEEAEKKKREEEDRKRKEDDERRRKEEEERRAKEDAERKKREEEDRKRAEEERKRAQEEALRKELETTAKREAEALRLKLEAEMKEKLEAERKAREEEDLKKRKETDERRSREYVERRAQEEEERKARDEAEAKARAAASASMPKIEVSAPPPPPKAPAASVDLGADLLADLDSFGKREEEEQKEKEEAERKAKEEAARKAKAEAERKAKEEADRKRREEEERARKEEEEKHAKEEAERKAKEEEERAKQEEADRKRKAKEALAAKEAEEKAAKAAAGAKAGKGAAKAKAAAADDDIEVSDDDLDTDDLKRDQKVAAEKARKTAREQPAAAVAVAAGRPKKWGKPAAIALFVLLIAGVGVLHVMPLGTAEYEKAASEAMGVPVKISSARLSMFTGLEVKLEGVSIGDAVKIRVVHGSPEVGSLMGARKVFSRVELEGVSVSQSQMADALLGKVAGENFRVARITIKQLVLDGPLKLPPLDVDATVSGDGSMQSVKLSGPDKLVVTLSPKGSDIGFDISAGSLALPFLPALNLSDFGMKGSANRAGVTTSEFDGRAYDGVISGTARIRWGASWTVEGELRTRGVKVAVFAPTLVSDGKVEARGAYTMTGPTPATLYESARLQGEFKIEKGVLGSFDLSRALQSGGANSGGTTIFNELTGQGVYDKGTVQITNASLSAGAMNAGMSLNIDASGGLSGRVVADVKTSNQNVRATLNISGKVQDPVIRK